MLKFLAERIRYVRNRPSQILGANEAAFTYALAGNKDKAIEWLNREVEEKGEGTTWLLVAPLRYDSLRDDPRFLDVVKRVGFAD